MRTSLFWILIQFMCLKLLKYLFNDVLFIAGEGTWKLISLLLKKSALRDGFEDASRLAGCCQLTWERECVLGRVLRHHTFLVFNLQITST